MIADLSSACHGRLAQSSYCLLRDSDDVPEHLCLQVHIDLRLRLRRLRLSQHHLRRGHVEKGGGTDPVASLDALEGFVCSRDTTARAHWGVENNLHWSLDVSFNEDKSRVRKDHAAENFATLRRIALALLKEAPSKVGIATRRLRAGWDHDFLLKVALGPTRQGTIQPD